MGFIWFDNRENIKMKQRQDLPNFKKLDINVDVEKLLAVINDNKDKLDKYRDYLNNGCDTFSTHCNDAYVQVPITSFKDEGYLIPNNKTGRTPEGDERNYQQIVDWAKGTYIEEVLKSFKSKATRTRLIIMKPKGFILPHMDYNTSYSVRYHIPIQTNPWSYMGIQRKNELPEVKHLPADGGVWFINQGWKHSAWNLGQTDRIHLIVSVMGQDDLN